MDKDRKKRGIEHWQLVNVGLAVYDALAVGLSFFLALWLRFDCRFSEIPPVYFSAYLHFIPFYVMICLVVFWCFRLYQSIWRFASINEMVRTVLATAVTFVIHTTGIILFVHRMPVTYYLVGIILQFAATIGIRYSYRFVLLLRENRIRTQNGHRVMLIGAGQAGHMVLRDLTVAEENTDQICCIIDDNPNKWGRYVEGVKVVGGRDDILAQAEKYHIDKIYLAIPSASAETRRDILNICKETGCELKTLPGIYQLVNNDVGVRDMHAVSMEDLLGREPVKVNMNEVFGYLSGKVILVTGGGGSIGSELCRQIAAHKPKRLIIFDVYENNAYNIQLELQERYPRLDLVTLIGSVRDSRRIDQVFAEYEPEVVYHAAAHKHVPLMETSPCEAIKNNAIGTYKTAYAAIHHGCKRFVLISTDKAVNPTNVMGASKRLCEMVIQMFDRKIKAGKADEIPALYTHTGDEYDGGHVYTQNAVNTEFAAVRFGNVLGSNGSVVPVFQRQIAKGGPVTVTHPDIIRYFMTIPEAVSLVLQTSVYARGGEIFVLDMGEPMKIDTLARNLIKLSGYRPDVDIKIEYTGLRPGEKLYEERLMAEEGLRKTANDMINIGRPLEFDDDEFLRQMDRLMDAAYANNVKAMLPILGEIVTTYKPAEKAVLEHAKAV